MKKITNLFTKAMEYPVVIFLITAGLIFERIIEAPFIVIGYINGKRPYGVKPERKE